MHSALSEANILLALKPLFYASRLLGLAPFTAAFERDVRSTAYTLVLSALILIGTARSLLTLTHHFHDNHNSVSWFVPRSLMVISSSASALTVLVLAATRVGDTLQDVCRRQVRIDRDLAVTETEYKAIRRQYLRTVAFQTLPITLMMVYDIVVDTSYIEILSMRFLTFLISYGSFVQFNTLVTYINNRCKIINREISASLKTKSPWQNKSKDKRPRLTLTHPLPLHSHKTFLLEPLSAELSEMNSCNRIKLLRSSHSQLFRISEMANSAFGIQLICIVLFLLVAIISYVNLNITRILQSNQDYATPGQAAIQDKYILSNIGWLTLDASLLVAVATSCHVTSQEANKSSVLVQQCLLVDNVGGQVKHELKEFAYQLMSNKPVFTAWDVFDLDMTLLLNLAATVTTYSIILIGIK